jgi:hypothetical protein
VAPKLVEVHNWLGGMSCQFFGPVEQHSYMAEKSMRVKIEDLVEARFEDVLEWACYNPYLSPHDEESEGSDQYLQKGTWKVDDHLEMVCQLVSDVENIRPLLTW